MNKVQQAIMASDLEYQKRIAHNNAVLLIRKDLQIRAVRELAEKLQNKEAFHQLTAWACAEEILKALNVDTDTLERDDDYDSRRDDYQEEDLG